MHHLPNCLKCDLKIARQCAVTLAGIKPASLFKLNHTDMRSFVSLKKCFKSKGVEFEVLKIARTYCLVLVYKRQLLEKVLFEPVNKSFLYTYGYNYSSAEDALKILKFKLKSKEFPHEIGIFLGYPYEDVKGFISNTASGYKLCGTWKSYDESPEKKQIFSRYKRCTDKVCKRVEMGYSLAQIFNAV